MKISQRAKNAAAMWAFTAGITCIPGSCAVLGYTSDRIESVKQVVPEVQMVENLEKSITEYASNPDLVQKCPELEDKLETYQNQLSALLEKCEVKEAREKIWHYNNIGLLRPALLIGGIALLVGAGSYLGTNKGRL
jgi:hypothetical protein